jgi:hypothetical protein
VRVLNSIPTWPGIKPVRHGIFEIVFIFILNDPLPHQNAPLALATPHTSNVLPETRSVLLLHLLDHTHVVACEDQQDENQEEHTYEYGEQDPIEFVHLFNEVELVLHLGNSVVLILVGDYELNGLPFKDVLVSSLAIENS